MANGDESVIISLKLNFIGGGEGAKAVMIYMIKARTAVSSTWRS